MVPPSCQLPVAPMLQVSVIAIRPAIDHNHHNTAMYFSSTMTLTFLLSYYYSMCSSSACSLNKGEFLKSISCFLLCHCIETMRTNPSYPGIPYLAMLRENSSCLGLISERGGVRHCHDVSRNEEVGSAGVSVALLIIVNI